MFTIIGVLGWLLFMLMLGLYRRGVCERNHLGQFLGVILMSGSIRKVKKEQFVAWLQTQSSEGIKLSTAALLTIQRTFGSDQSALETKLPLVFHNMVAKFKNGIDVDEDDSAAVTTARRKAAKKITENMITSGKFNGEELNSLHTALARLNEEPSK